MRAVSVALGAALLIALAAAAFLVWAARPAIAPIEPPSPADFSADLVGKGAQLAAIGDCAGCHTNSDGSPYAGGVALPTPFGSIYGTNITPDPDTGIGSWSRVAFARAMREGIDRRGRHLYPAFPYDHFNKLADGDIDAIYAFLMTREPVRATSPPNRLVFPLNARIVAAAWKLLFLRPARSEPRSDKSDPWNRGAYLVEGLGHCGACHTPRNILGAEESQKALAGGEQEGWIAPSLDQDSPAPIHWTEESLFAYLRVGSDRLHGVAAGPMASVVRHLRPALDADVRAMAVYIASTMGEPAPERRSKEEEIFASLPKGGSADAIATAEPARSAADAAPTGAQIFAATCSGCHTNRSSGPLGGRPLVLQTAVALASPRNLIEIILHGIEPVEGEPGEMMPGFADVLTDKQIAELAAYVRSRFGDGPAWSNIEDVVRGIRNGR